MTEQLEGQMSIADLDLPFGKMFPELSPVTDPMIFGPSSRRFAVSGEATILYLDLRRASGKNPGVSWETVGALPGVSMMLNTGESPNGERGSTLSQILQRNAPEKYFLSPRACAGILRRAEHRGKELPAMLKEALEEVVQRDSRPTKDPAPAV